MQRVRIRSLSIAMIAIAAVTASSAQSVVYLDKDYRTVTERSYAYKRVKQYKEEIIFPEFITDIHGETQINARRSGYYRCSMLDYYPNGQVALVANISVQKTDCTGDFSYDGQVVYYYPSGRMRKKEFYKIGGFLQGDVITYAEDGRVLTKEHFEHGQRIDERKYAVAANQPLIGKWKTGSCQEPRLYNTCVEFTLLWTIDSNGILHTHYQNNTQEWDTQTNWKYTSTSSAIGVLEGFRGETLDWRGDLRWISRNEFEYTTTFDRDPNIIGQRLRFFRQ